MYEEYDIGWSNHVWNYKIIYEFTGNQIIVHRIIHSKRDMKRALRGIR